MLASKAAIEKMGFHKHPDTDVLQVHFNVIKVYSLRGMHFDEDCDDRKSEAFALGERCTAVIAQSVNEASKLLVGDIFVDDEEKWRSEKKAIQPFLLIHFKESIPRELKGGYRKENDGCICTYDAFPDCDPEISQWEKDDLPGIITSLIVNFSTFGRIIELLPVESTIFGITKEGVTLWNTKLTVKMRGYGSSPKSIEQFNTVLNNSEKMLPISKDVCRNFYAALDDPDRVKKFTKYFCCIERHTKETYESIDYDRYAAKEFDSSRLVNKRDFNKLRDLAKQFRCCAIAVWNNIEESDVDTFSEAKEVRNRLSHGEHVEETELPVEKIKELALKLLACSEHIT